MRAAGSSSSSRADAARTLGATVGLAALLTATSGEWAPPAVAVLGSLLTVLGLVLVGRAAGWPSIPAATLAIVVLGLVASAVLYDDQADVPPDLRVSGMDEIGRDPASVILVLPVVWLVLALAVLSRRWGGRAHRRGVGQP